MARSVKLQSLAWVMDPGFCDQALHCVAWRLFVLLALTAAMPIFALSVK